ncbi:MAG: hypothetical protein MUC63_00640 [Planctomycetes bacterium]|nr:hypothetical protein [Planctomycetota bacterium]
MDSERGADAESGKDLKKTGATSRKSRESSAPFSFMKNAPGPATPSHTRAEESSSEAGHRRPPSGRTARAPAASGGLPPRTLALIGGGIAVLLLVVIILFLVAGSGDKEPPPAAPPRASKPPERKAPSPSPVPPSAPAATPTEARAKKAWEEAEAFDRANPGAWLEARGRYIDALEVCEKTRYEKMARDRLEEGDRKADLAGEKAFRAYEKEAAPLLDRRDYGKAIELYERFRKDVESSQAWAAKAIEAHQKVVLLDKNWTSARRCEIVSNRISDANKAAVLSLFAESSFDLKPALEGSDLSEWKPDPAAAWSATGGVLTGRTESDPVQILFGSADWADYVLEAEARILKGSRFLLLVHASETVFPVEFDASKIKAADAWFLVRCVVFGELAHFRAFKGLNKIHVGNIQCGKRGETGGFGFRLADKGSEVAFRNVRYRRLSTADSPWVPLREGWHPLYSGHDLGGADGESDPDAKGTFSMEAGVLVGSSSTGGTFIEFGSPSWTRFELAFSLRNVEKAFQIDLRRPLGPRELVDGFFEQAILEIPDAVATGSAWKEIVVQVGEQEAVLLVDGTPKGKAKFESMTQRDAFTPVRIGFRKVSHAGGRFEIKDLRVKIDARGGGF